MARVALLLVAALFVSLSLAASFDGLANKEVKREVDLTSQLTVQTSVITVQNTGAKEATTYYLSVFEDVAANVADVTATDASGAKLAVGAAEKASGYAAPPRRLTSPAAPRSLRPLALTPPPATPSTPSPSSSPPAPRRRSLHV